VQPNIAYLSPISSNDTSRLLVSIGFGFFVELTHDETLTFVDKRIRLLQHRHNLLNDKANRIRAQITFALQTIAQLQNLAK
jgi:prefoldin subunit 5